MKKEPEQGIGIWANLASEAIRSRKKEKISSAIQELQRRQCILMRHLNSLSKDQRLPIPAERSPVYLAGILGGIIYLLIAIDNYILMAEEESFIKHKYVVQVLKFLKDGPQGIDFTGNGPENLRKHLGIEQREFHNLCNEMLRRDLLVRTRYGAGYGWNIGIKGSVTLEVLRSRTSPI